jgi:hypothetical protein
MGKDAAFTGSSVLFWVLIVAYVSWFFWYVYVLFIVLCMIKEKNMKQRNIPMFKVAMNPEVNAELLRVLHSGWIGQGPMVREFEGMLSQVFQNDKVLTLSSGTHGLSLALRLC